MRWKTYRSYLQFLSIERFSESFSRFISLRNGVRWNFVFLIWAGATTLSGMIMSSNQQLVDRKLQPIET